MTQTQTVADVLAAVIARSKGPVGIDDLHKRAEKLAKRTIPRVTVTTQLIRQDRFKRVSRGVYDVKKPRAKRVAKAKAAPAAA